MTISLCMIVRDEERSLGKCLSSVAGLADEIIVVDTGSKDRTKEIAAEFTDKIYDFEWVDDFSAARNYSFEQATKEYIMWLDADDIILPDDAAKLLALKKSLPIEVDVVMMKYNTGFDRQGRVNFSFFRERLLKRSRNYRWNEPVHEYVKIWGKIINSDICVTHTKDNWTASTRNIEIYEKHIGAGLSSRGKYYYARELKDNGRFTDAIHWFNEFLDLGQGWVEDNITACGELAKCHLAEGNSKEALTAMLRSFSFDTPRAEICCLLGYYFKSLEKYKLAAYWFGLVLSLVKPSGGWGFIQEDMWGYIPCIECAVCYDRLGDLELASHYNDLAAAYKPDSAAVLHNKLYFAQKMHDGSC